MAWTETIGAKYTHDKYFADVVNEINVNANVLAQLEAEETTHPGYHWVREDGSIFDTDGFITCSDTVTSLTDAGDEQNLPLRLFALRTEVCTFSNQYDTYTSQVEAQVRSLLRKSGRAMEHFLINGTGVSPQPTGLKNQIAASQVISSGGANGDSLTFDKLDDLIAKVKVRGPNMAFITNRSIQDKFRALARSSGYSLDEVMLPNGVNVPSFRGYPILDSEYVRANESKGDASTLSSVYFTNLDFPGGYGFGMVLGIPPEVPGIIRRAGPFSIIQATHSATKLSYIYFLQARVAFVLLSTQAAARAKEIVTVTA